MTALTQPPGRLLTVAEYIVLGEDDRSRWELQEGNLIMSPSPSPQHMIAGAEFYIQLRNQLPADLCVVPDVDVDLELVPEREPGTARRPDLVVVEREELDRVKANGGLLRARCVHLVVEIVSPGSRRMDRVVKRGEYADAGIPNYWIVDLEPPISLIACHLAGTFGYQDAGEASGIFETVVPVPLSVNLTAIS